MVSASWKLRSLDPSGTVIKASACQPIMLLFPRRYPCCNSGPIANAVTRTCHRIRRKPASALSSALFAFLALKVHSMASAQTVAGSCLCDRGVRQIDWPTIRHQGTGSTSPPVVGKPRNDVRRRSSKNDWVCSRFRLKTGACPAKDIVAVLGNDIHAVLSRDYCF